MSRKIYVVGHATHYASWMQAQLVNNMEEADLVLFTGGEDVSPKYYQDKKHPTTSCNPERDSYEIQEARKAIALNKKLIGVCRGSQLLCVLAGGNLVQDQENPAYYHDIQLYDGKLIAFTSTHHQAQFPFVLPENEYKILGWTENLCEYHKNGDDQELNPPKEVEMCYYPGISALAIQPHPEAMSITSPGVVWLQNLLNQFMTNNL